MNICVFGASSDRLDKQYYHEAEAVGRLTAEYGHTLVFGGGKDGLMAACAAGALKAGGKVVGIAPAMFEGPGFLLEDCSEMMLTESMNERKEKMVEISDAFIALPGGVGTMDELFEVLTLKQLGIVNSPLVLLNTDCFYTPLFDYLRQMADGGFMSKSCLQLVRLCAGPEEAVAAALRPETVLGSLERLENADPKI